MISIMIPITLFLFNLVFAQSQPVVTQTVGTSAFQVVTSREVKASTLINQAMQSNLQEELSLAGSDEINSALYEIAIYRESQTLSATKLSAEELQELVETVKSRLHGNREWKKLDVQDHELKAWVERKQSAQSFLELKSGSLTSIITDQEIQDYYEKNRAKFGSTPLSEQKETIRKFLQKESKIQRMQDWISALKVKYQVRNDLLQVPNAAETPREPTP